MNRRKSSWLLSSAILFCIIILAVFAGSDSEIKSRMIFMYDSGCKSLLKDIISDAARNHDLERQLLIQLRDRVEPSSGEYAFLARDQVLIFVRDDMTTDLFENQKTSDLTAMTEGGPAYRINTEKIYSDGVEYTAGIYTRESFILNQYGYDVLERRMFLSLIALILATLVTIFLLLEKLQKTQAERDGLKRKNKLARTHIELLQEQLAEDALNTTGMQGFDLSYNQYRFNFYLNASHGIYIDGEMGDVHPHTWEISINAAKSENNFVMFSEVERAVEEFLDGYQNRLFNDFKPFDIVNPTLENITVYLLDSLQGILNPSGWQILSIEVSETPARSFVISLI